MLRARLAQSWHSGEEGFFWRGQEALRIEGFSDAVFAFAVTLLVVSLEVPNTFDELLASMRGFIAFAICFAVLLTVWFEQYKFFRRYGLNDNITMRLNAVLLFFVLFYVYPLKFLFTAWIDQLLGFSTPARRVGRKRHREHRTRAVAVADNNLRRRLRCCATSLRSSLLASVCLTWRTGA